MENMTVSQGLINLAGLLMNSARAISTAADRESLSIQALRGDSLAKVARQYVNSAQTLIRLSCIKKDIADLTEGACE